MTKAKKVTPPTDMDAHNAAIQDAEANPPEVEAPTPVAVLTTAEVAEALQTTPRTLRKFLRSKASGIEPVGQGKRYALSPDSVPALARKFDKWAKVDADADAAEAEAAEVNAAEAAVADADAELEEFEELSYSADELEAMTVPQLRELAAEYQIEVPTKIKKAQLVEMLAD